MRGLGSDERRVQNGCAELLSLLSADEPRLLRPHVGTFLEGLESGAEMVRWEAVCTLGNIAEGLDRKDASVATSRIQNFLSDPSVVLKGHSVQALSKIALHHPQRAQSIFGSILAVRDQFPGRRIGVVLECCTNFATSDSMRRRVRDFATEHRDSEHAVVARKARRALREL
jgi:hypothetical protein